jgi:hypothetical protein
LFYVTLGATVGVLVVRRAGDVLVRWTPEGIAAQAGGLGERVSLWWSEVQDAAAERETELRRGLGIETTDEESAA